MEKIEHTQLQETLYYQQLSNGLDVYILPKRDYNKAYATFTTKYGSVDNMFQVEGQNKEKVVDGIAHFLEHKMFEQESGEDVFQEFSKQGASANAFTSFTRTAYLFSCTDQIEANLLTLLNYVQSPYFTDENVEKEKGIIGQEIQMYDDNSDWQSYFGLIQALYQNHPIRIDIAGTIESIAKITKESLYTCYNTFYHPSNMVLFLVGPVDPQAMIGLIEENQSKKQFTKQGEIQRFYPDEPNEVAEKKKITVLPVGIPKCLFGFKDPSTSLGLKGDALFKQELCMQIALEAMIGTGSELYQSLYDEGLIDDSFGYDYSIEEDYGFSMMGGDARDPEQLLQKIKEQFPAILEAGIAETEFERIRKKKIGANLRSFNSPEWIANQFTSYRFRGADLFRAIPLLEELTLQDVNRSIRDHIDWNRFAVSIVKAEK